MRPLCYAGYFGQLKDLKLEHICCRQLDLKSATCLTSVSLRVIELCSLPCDLVLPSSVKRLEFVGYSLFTKIQAAFVQELLPNLTEVTLGMPCICGNLYTCSMHAEFSSLACVPTLPGSLRHLHVTERFVKRLLDSSAQTCLRRCTGLEHLTWAAHEDPEGELRAWVQAARHVHILDNDPIV